MTLYYTNEKKLHSIIHRFEGIMRKYNVHGVSLKIPPGAHHTLGLATVIGSLKRYCKEHKIPLHVCTIRELIRQGISADGRNKKVSMQALAAKHKKLHIRVLKEQKNNHRHYIKMFEAIAAAELLQELLLQK